MKYWIALLLNLLLALPLISQADFITTWRTTAPNESITIPTTTIDGEVYNYDVDWGDGQSTTGEIGDATHTYAVAGDYQVSISGAFPRIYFNNVGDKNKIISIDQWGTGVWTSMGSAFRGCENLAGQASDVPNLSIVADMSFMFAGKVNSGSAFNQDIGNWDVSNVINMSSMFASANSFNQNIGAWNVGNVTNMAGMFFQAGSFNQNIGGWAVTKVTSMAEMFRQASLFNQNLNAWNVELVTNMRLMFSYAGSFNGNISAWDPLSVTTMDKMFENATSFNQPIGAWTFNNLNNLDETFHGASAFNQPLANWDVSKVTITHNMFRNATSFDQDISAWNVGLVQDMIRMFENASSFDQNIGAWDISAATHMSFMFKGVGLSVANYDALLLGWSAQSVQSNVVFDGGNSIYCAGQSGRVNLINNNNWTITDNGLDPACPPCTTVNNTNDTGFGSLRNAITCLNTMLGPTTITFNIPGTGPHVIAIQSELPSLTANFATIDGTTQLGNTPMAGKIIIDQTALSNPTNVALRISGTNSAIYGLSFVNTNINFLHSALFYAETSLNFILGGNNRGNWFVGNKWDAAVFLKENINGGLIQSNLFQSATAQMETAIVVNSGDNAIHIGGSQPWQRNHFYNCSINGIWLRNDSNGNFIENNYFEGNVTAIFNDGDFLAGSNMGNEFMDNEFRCNNTAISNTANGNLGIAPPTIICQRIDYISGTGAPNALVQIYKTPNNCVNGICQGEEVIFNTTCDGSGNFEVIIPLVDYLTVGNTILATQTESTKGTSAFSGCSIVELSCNGDFVITNNMQNQCYAVATLTISAAQGNNNQLIDILGGDGKILCSINANGNDLGATAFNVYVSSTDRQDGNGLEYMRRNITIQPATQPSTSVTVRFYYTQNEYNAILAADNTINSYTDIDFSKFDITCASSPSGAGTFVAQTGSGLYGPLGDVFIETRISSFSTVFANGQNMVLPVELTSFTARAQKETAILYWQTASEINHKGWNIQQSTNGHSWKTIDWVTGKGDGGNYYTYIDSNPANGISFYRLEQIDFNEEKTYSKIKAVEIDHQKQTVYPNPVTDMLRYTGFEQGAVFKFYNTLGELVLTKEIYGNELVDMSGLHTGAYFLKVDEGARSLSFRLFKD